MTFHTSAKKRLQKAALFAVTLTLASGLAFGIAPAHAQAENPVAIAQGGQNADTLRGQAAFQVARALIDATVKETGIAEKELLRALFEGKILKDIIAGKNGNVETVKTTTKQTILTNATQAVTDKKLTQAQADMLLANIDTVLDKAINGEFRAQFASKADAVKAKIKDKTIIGRLGGTNLLFEETAKATKLSQRDLLAQLRTGQTLAQIATANSADPKAIVDAAVKTATAKLNKLVKAGKVKQEEADKLLATLPADFEKVMNQVNPIEAAAHKKEAKPTKNPAPAATPTT